MWNKKEMSQLDATLTRVPLTLTLNFQGQIASENGGPIIMERKGLGR